MSYQEATNYSEQRAPYAQDEDVYAKYVEDAPPLNSPTTSTTSAIPIAITKGAIIGDDIELEILLGRGAFGEVWKAKKLKTGETVAIKFQRQKKLTSARKEFSLMRSNIHDNVLRLLDYIEPLHALVMEFAGGGSLQEFLQKQSEPIPWSLRMKLILEICSAMKFLHRQGLFHRDLRCPNVLLTDNLEAKVSDFGIALFKNVNESAAYVSMSYRGKDIYHADATVQSFHDPIQEAIDCDIRFFAITMIKMLRFGTSLDTYDHSSFPEWTPASYRTLCTLALQHTLIECSSFNEEIFDMLYVALLCICHELEVNVPGHTDVEGKRGIGNVTDTTVEESELDKLLTTIKERYASNRGEAADKLFKLSLANNTRARNTLAEQLPLEVDFTLRNKLAKMLGELESSDANVINALISIIQEDLESFQMRREQTLAPRGIEAFDEGRKCAFGSLRLLARKLSAVQLLQSYIEIGKQYKTNQFVLKVPELRDGTVNENLVASLIDSLRQHESASMRRNAAYLLGMMGTTDQKVVATLVYALNNDADSFVRNCAAKSLGEIGVKNEEVVLALVAGLKNIHIEVRDAAGHALGKLQANTPEVVDALLECISTDRTDARRACVQALGKINSTEPRVMDCLIQLISDSDILISKAAASALAELQFGERGPIEKLANTLRTSDNPVKRHQAAECLQTLKVKDPIASAALVHALLHDTDSGVRQKAAYSIGFLVSSGEDIVNTVCSLLRNQEEEEKVKMNVIYSLKPEKVYNLPIAEALIEAITHDSSWSVRARAAEAVTSMGIHSHALSDALVNALLNDREISVRIVAAQLLGAQATFPEKVISAFIQALKKDESAYVRTNIAKSICCMTDATNQELKLAVADAIRVEQDSYALLSLINALEHLRFHDITVISLLLDVVKRSNLLVQQAACKLISTAGNGVPEAIDQLTEAIKLAKPESTQHKFLCEALNQCLVANK